ncbi:MAG: hypothetical protein AABW92_02475 [Nanoarchaeota archaeon]
MAAQNEIKLSYNAGTNVILGLGIFIAAIGYIVSHAMQNPKK